MLITDIWWALDFAGKGLVLVGVGMIVRGFFYRHPKEEQFLQEYETAKIKKEKPSFDAEYAYAHRLLPKRGLIVVGVGLMVWVLGSFLLERY